MSARSAGHLLLALAVLGAAGVAALRVTSGSLDVGLGVVTALGVLAAATLVVGDRRRRSPGDRGPRAGPSAR